MPGLVELHTDHLEAHYVPRPKVLLGPGRGGGLLRRPARDQRHHHGARFAARLARGRRRGRRWRGRRAGRGDRARRATPTCCAPIISCTCAARCRCRSVVEEAQELIGRARRAARLADGPHAGPAPVPRRAQAARLLPRQERRPDRRRARRAVRQAASPIRQTLCRGQLSRAGRARARARHAAGEPRRHHARSMSREAVADGVAIAEFPTTIEAAEALHAAGIDVLMGAPNLVRGGSHAGNVATADSPATACSTSCRRTTCRRAC